jgi:polar amino acid transport system substrate-binding protein
MRALFSTLVGCLLLSISAVTFAADKVVTPPSFNQIVAAHKLRVGTYISIPYAMKTADGKFAGSEIDIAQRLAKDIGATLEVKTFEWEQLIPALQRGDIDIIISDLSITPERALQVYFSNPYASSGVGIATNIKLTSDFGSIDNLNRPDIAIGAIGGTVSEDVARQVFPKASIKVFTDDQKAEDALVKGLLHAFVRGEPVPRFMALRHPKEVDVPIAKPLVATREAFAVRKGDNDFVNFLNAWIVAREADAWLISTHKYWLEGLSWQETPAK